MEVAERLLAQGHLVAPSLAFMHGEGGQWLRINMAEAFESSMLPALRKVLGRLAKGR